MVGNWAQGWAAALAAAIGVTAAMQPVARAEETKSKPAKTAARAAARPDGSDANGPNVKVPDAKGIEFFEKKIRPVLVAQCYECHSARAKKLKGELSLDTREGLRRGGESGEIIVPGKPEASLLLSALRHDDLEMPPKRKLPESVVADFETWIKLGAPDPRTGGEDATRPTIDFAEARKFWAFQKPVPSAPPPVNHATWPRDELDRYVIAALEARQLKPVADADRRVLLRRVYFDLIGLPPSPEQVEAFLADGSSEALATVVDRLLRSPQFGERWGRHWLDVARYGESNGNVDNNLFPDAWRYRDWVIASLNADKPYDQFVREQIAGDLLPAQSNAETNEHRIATGFLALTSKPRAQNNPDFGMDLVADQIEVATTGILGLTVACARCHDHKFDPIPQTDYYALAGIFTSSEMLYGVTTRNNKKAKGGSAVYELLATGAVSADPQVAATRAKIEQLETRRDALQQEFDQRKKKKNKQAKLAAKGGGKSKAQPQVGPAPRVLRQQMQQLDQQIAELSKSLPPGAGDGAGHAMGVREGKPGDCQLCIRGESDRRGAKVPRGFATVIGDLGIGSIDQDSSGRLELARWLSSDDNPLTARVMANRIWQHLFGQGIVPTVDNFGALGEGPSNQALLDHLALRLIENGWSIKQTIRQIVLSRAYGLSSDYDSRAYQVDPENRLVWRHSPRRLEAEAIRDAMLAVGGQLDLTPPGGSGIARFGSQQVRNNIGAEIAKMESNHRSVYLPAVRQATPETLEPFDMPDASLVIGARDVTTVPAQALFLMNSPFVVEQSRRAAERLLAEEKIDDARRVELAYLRALSRLPTSQERERALELVASLAERDDGAKKDKDEARLAAWASVCQALLATAEFRYTD